MNDDAANAAVADKQIRAASNDKERADFRAGKIGSVSQDASSVRGSTQNCAGPPTRSVVCFASGSDKSAPRLRPRRFLSTFPRSPDSAASLAKLFVHIAGAETEHQIAIKRCILPTSQCSRSSRGWYATPRCPCATISSAIVCPVIPGNGRLTRRINVGDDDVIGVVECRAKFDAQRFGPRIAMRLKHRQHAFATGGFGGRERGADLRRMMGVIIDEQKALALIFDLKAAARVLKSAVTISRFSRKESRVRWRARSRRARC